MCAARGERSLCSFCARRHHAVLPTPAVHLPSSLQTFGRIEDMLVCDNMADHLIGNVYIKFSDEEEAAAALTALNGRWYAGRQASFVARWRGGGASPARAACAPRPPRSPRPPSARRRRAGRRRVLARDRVPRGALPAV